MAGDVGDHESRAIRVMTYNVLVDAGADGDDTWPERVETVASVVRFDRPDFVGFQEATAAQYADLRERLPGFEWIGVGRFGGDEGEFCPVGFRSDRFERLDSGTFWLSESPASPGSVSWDAAFPRIVTWVFVRDRTSGSQFVVANTHFDHDSAKARRESARLVRQRLIEGRDEPVIFCGDLNAVPDSDPYLMLTINGELRDARKVSSRLPLGPRVTFTGFTDPSDGQRIDHVLVSGSVAVDQYAVRA
jgi:endonuclease/exonuclease/phosphatase family metal-dependent hydrolase